MTHRALIALLVVVVISYANSTETSNLRSSFPIEPESNQIGRNSNQAGWWHQRNLYGSNPNDWVNGRKTLLPETYMENGYTQNLFRGRQFPVTIDVYQPYEGRLEVTLDCHDRVTYIYDYQVHDGWVTMRPTWNYRGSGSGFNYPELVDVQRKLEQIFKNVEQLGFERDQQLQFIASNSRNRVVFR